MKAQFLRSRYVANAASIILSAQRISKVENWWRQSVIRAILILEPPFSVLLTMAEMKTKKAKMATRIANRCFNFVSAVVRWDEANRNVDMKIQFGSQKRNLQRTKTRQTKWRNAVRVGTTLLDEIPCVRWCMAQTVHTP